MAVLVLVATAAFLIYRRYRRPKPYSSVESSELNEFSLDKDDTFEEDA